jgi:hypothetical protein
MRKALSTMLIGAIVVMVLVGGFAVYKSGIIPFVKQSIIGNQTCSDVFCNDFNYICCGERLDYQNTLTITNGNYWQCPSYATKCEITVSSYTSGLAYMIGSTNCNLGKDGIWPFQYDAWKCDNGVKHTEKNIPMIVSPGDYVYMWGQGSVTFSLKVYKLVLVDCGRAVCSAGESGTPIQGSTSCSFVPAELFSKVYNSNGNLISNPNVNMAVPSGNCWQYTTYALRRVCGNTCEYCDSNSDCASNYPYQYTYQGQIYGATCQSGQLQLYGCKKETSCLEYDVVSGQQKCVNQGIKSWCEQITAVSVQCCPGTNTCGTGLFCDSQTYTCKQSAQCQNNYDCSNMGKQCDWVNKKIKEPVCQAGQCVWQTTSSVDCCYNENCASGYYCGIDYKCYQEAPGKKDCPYACCVDDNRYYDRPCSTGENCCGDNTCQIDCNGHGGNGESSVAKWLVPLIAGLLTFFMMGGINSIKEQEWDKLGIALGVAIGVAFLVAWVLKNLVAILVGSAIAVALGGILIYFLGGALLVILFFIMQAIRTVRNK